MDTRFMNLISRVHVLGLVEEAVSQLELLVNARTVDLVMQREIVRLVPEAAPNEMRTRVEIAVRTAIEQAVRDGKTGSDLRFDGHPDALHVDWPRGLPSPPYPTPGVWHDGYYCGDDG